MRFQTNKELILSNAISAVGQRHDDPTYSILKAHLLVEEPLRLFLARIVPHSSALEGSRLGFAQTLAISTSLCTWLQPDDWIWGMASKLNSLRNDLAHNLEPDEMVKRVADCVGLWATRHSLPVSDAVRDPLKQHKDKTGAMFS